MALPLIILFLIIYAYSLLILLIVQEIEKNPEPIGGPVEYRTGVSVVVPFRNEEDHLPSLLDDLSAQSYPGGLLEILLVDDHSEDASGKLAAAEAARERSFRYLELPEGNMGKRRPCRMGYNMPGMNGSYNWMPIARWIPDSLQRIWTSSRDKHRIW